LFIYISVVSHRTRIAHRFLSLGTSIFFATPLMNSNAMPVDEVSIHDNEKKDVTEPMLNVRPSTHADEDE